MKKGIFTLLLTIFILIACVPQSMAKNLKKDYGKGEITPRPDMIDTIDGKRKSAYAPSHTKWIINFRKGKFIDEERLTMTISPLAAKIKGKIVFTDSAQITSGIFERAMGSDVVMGSASIHRTKNNDELFFLEINIPNYASYAKVPVVEYLWGLARDENGNVGEIFLDPSSSWVCHNKIRGHFVGIIIYPDGTIKPLKNKSCSLGIGRHPELK